MQRIFSKLNLLNKLVKINEIGSKFDDKLSSQKFDLLKCVQVNSKPVNVSTKFKRKKSSSYVCKVKGCGKRFTFAQNLHRHSERLHHGELIECRDCSAEFRTTSDYNRHKSRRYEDRDMICIECKRNFRTACLLRAHTNVQHKSSRNVKCTIKQCHKMFRNQFELSRHLVIKHGDESQVTQKKKYYQCTFGDCTMKFTERSHLKRHIDRHEANKRFKCEHKNCGNSFVTKYELKKHFMRHHSKHKPHKCCAKGCDKRFTTGSELKSHLKSIHSGLKKSSEESAN